MKEIQNSFLKIPDFMLLLLGLIKSRKYRGKDC